LFLGWRSVPGGSKQRRKKKSTTIGIYERMQKSICLSTSDAPPSESALSISQYVVGNTVEKCQQNMMRVNTVINKVKYRIIEYHCILGAEMMAYKLLSFSKFCDECTVNNAAALSCRRCVKMTCNITELSNFMEFSCELLNCTKDYVNFLISLGRLCKQYPNFKYVTLSLNEIKANMKELTKKTTEDAGFWNDI